MRRRQVSFRREAESRAVACALRRWRIHRRAQRHQPMPNGRQKRRTTGELVSRSAGADGAPRAVLRAVCAALRA